MSPDSLADYCRGLDDRLAYLRPYVHRWRNEKKKYSEILGDVDRVFSCSDALRALALDGEVNTERVAGYELAIFSGLIRIRDFVRRVK